MVQVDQPVTAPVSQAQVSRRIVRATGALMLIQIVMRGFGVIEKMILGRLFGTSYVTDAYNAAKDIAFYIFTMVDQVVMHSFLPVFVQRIREHDEKDAWRLASTAINILMLLMAVVAIGGIHYAPNILHLAVPNWYKDPNPRLIPLTIKLMRCLLVAVIFLASSSLTYCLLNSYKKFALPSAADLALKGTVLVFAIIFARTWGPYALAVGFVFGAIAKLVVHGYGLRSQLLHYRPVIDLRHAGLRQFAWLALPLILSTACSEFRQVMDTRFISALPEGSLSAIKFAKTICDMPVNFFPFAFGIALFPFLADIAVAGDKTRLREMLMMITRMMFIIFLPLSAIIFMQRVPLVEVIYGSKAMLTTTPLQVYALYMIVGALEIIVLQFFFAMSDTLWPSIIAILIIPLHIATAYAGIHYLGLGTIAIAGALLLSKGTKVVILYAMIRRKLHSLEGPRTLALIGKVLLALLPLLAMLLLGNRLMRVHHHHASTPTPTALHQQIPGSSEATLSSASTASSTPAVGKAKKNKGGLLHKLHSALQKVLALFPFAFFSLLGLSCYLAVLYWLRAEEISLLLARVQEKLRKGRTPRPTLPAEPA